MACDPTTITSAVIATPISMLGNALQTCITDWWHLEEYAEEGRRDHRLYTPVLQNVADPVLERQLESLHQLADSSDETVGCLGFFKGSSRAHRIQDRRTHLRESIISHGMVTLLSHQGLPPAVHLMHRYTIPDVYLETSNYAGGIENRIQRLECLLVDEAGPQLIGLFGMAGVGKSSLAALVCRQERVKQHFRNNIFWVDVSNVGCQGEVLQLQMELFSAFTGHTLARSFASDTEGRQALCDYLSLQQKRYLLVYDNVWKRSIVEHLHFELNSSDIKTNTKTLVLSRKGDLLQGSRFNCSSVEVPPLSREDAYRLFCKHAFHGNEAAPEDAKRYVQTLIARCSGIPMVVNIMAKYVSRDEQRMRQVGFWKHVINEVGREESEDDYQKLLNMMKLSYEDLKKDVKQLFLLYATMLSPGAYNSYRVEYLLYHMWLALQSGTEEDEVMRIKFDRAFDALVAGFLVGVDPSYPPRLIINLAHHIMAADKSLGFFIDQYPQSQEELESAELINIYSPYKCSGSIQGLESATHLKVMIYYGFLYQPDYPSSLRFLSIRMPNAEDCQLSRLLELRFLNLQGLGDDGIERLLMALRRLSKLEVLHLGFEVKVELDLSFLGCMLGLVIVTIFAPPGSTVRNLHHVRQLKRLKRLHSPITCTNLENQAWEHGNKLESFQIGGLKNFYIIREAVEARLDRLLGSLSGPCSKLEELCLRNIRITRLPSEFNFPNLEQLELTIAMESLGCSSISLPKLKILRLDGCGLLSEMPFTSCPALKQLHVRGLPWLVEIGDDEFPSISKMTILHCEKLEKLRVPGSILELCLEGLRSLVQVGRLPSILWRISIIDCEKLNILPSSQAQHLILKALPSLVEIGTVSTAQRLAITGCERLAALPSPLLALTSLTLEAIPYLVEFGSEAELPSLGYLEISNCEKLRILHQMQSLHSLDLKKLPALVQIGAEFPRLRTLCISECERLAGLPSLPSLEDLTLVRLTVDQFAQFLGVQQRSISSAPQLLEIGPKYPSLTSFWIIECQRLAIVPSAPQLERLYLTNLPSLVAIGPDYPRLTYLKISECESLATLPFAPSLKTLQLTTLPSLVEIGPEYPSLTYLEISGCESLATLPAAPNLKTLQLTTLSSLVEIGPEYPSLTTLKISKCERLATIPSAPGLKERNFGWRDSHS